MKGIELSRDYYEEYGKKMLAEQFPELLCRISVGIAGEGSDCFGYDDGLSRDHDFEVGFCIWLDKADYEKYGYSLHRAYTRLPKSYKGVERPSLSPVGGSRRGVMEIGEFYSKFLGSELPPANNIEWLYTPSEALAAATNGAVFYDGSGKFSAIREALKAGYPQDVRKKKISAHLVMMAQSGEYNYPRAIARGEIGAAQLALGEFVNHTLSAIFLLNNVYRPFYKWAYRALRDLPLLPSLEASLLRLGEMDNSPDSARLKSEIISSIGTALCSALCEVGLCRTPPSGLEQAAFSLLAEISDSQLRNMHIMEGI